MMTHESLFQRACNVIPGGVNSPVRAFNGVGGTPLYVESGKGSKIRTADGRTLTDFCCSWGAMILGHANDEVVAAIQAQAAKGTTFGINTPDEVAFAERLCALVPGMERVRLVNSGTEAVMTALRIARGVTGRKRIIKFDGCYHGHSDSVLVSAGSGLLTGGMVSSLGVSRHVASDTFVAPYNDNNAVNELIREKGSEIAAIIVEPVAGNMGLVLPEPEFLAKLRRSADRCGALLIFDEVIDGFRFALSSYAKTVGVKPDLITLGKVIGGGLPLAAVGGAAVFMDELAPQGKIYQAGTLSGNPLAVAAGLKTLEILARDDPYPRMAALGHRMAEFINTAAASKGLPFHCAQYHGVFTLFFTQAPIRSLSDTKRCDTRAYAQLFHAILNRGYYLPPSQFEIGFISAAHSEDEVMSFAQAVVG
ncbi:MAG TPA: glutamate-1-semialdehyde 2,1-aminomutase [Kiritimatiellia bacterium]|nr:glutamate-1-semialdehyde 2,1-aminomutase [Kiritimatiellia bacterium]HPS08677.1 glutamate-1-semialdehyde 2,1-aminomutase [Kiritimatiellia bacterium]